MDLPPSLIHVEGDFSTIVDLPPIAGRLEIATTAIETATIIHATM